ncbi:MAG: SOS response-associated peptidase [Schleiferiaceae bacterium]|nr:SOS response-associated peptidase [Schleiferiaceae bacterium]
MCGRYVQISRIDVVEKRFGVRVPQPELFPKNPNVSASERAPVIASDRPKEVQLFQFGLVPHWAQKPMCLLNARAEGDHNPENNPGYLGSKGIIQKPSFRKAIRSQRCLVLADAFIEGPEDHKLSEPYLVYLRKQERPFAFAGIWDEWHNPTSGEIIRSFAIITVAANTVTQRIRHHRSPVIIPRDAEQDWLSLDSELSDITELLKPYPGERLNAYPISPAIKNPRNKDVKILLPTGERLFSEEEYESKSDLRLEGMRPS